MTEFTFRVPGAPPYDLNPNKGQGSYGTPATRRKVARLKAEMKHDWKMAIVSERNKIRPFPNLPLFPGPVRAEITYGLPKGAQRWDEDNLTSALKWGLDQLQAMGIIVNDNLLKADVVEQVRDPDGIGYVSVTVKERT